MSLGFLQPVVVIINRLSSKAAKVAKAAFVAACITLFFGGAKVGIKF
jgi:hypothetical protein